MYLIGSPLNSRIARICDVIHAGKLLKTTPISVGKKRPEAGKEKTMNFDFVEELPSSVVDKQEYLRIYTHPELFAFLLEALDEFAKERNGVIKISDTKEGSATHPTRDMIKLYADSNDIGKIPPSIYISTSTRPNVTEIDIGTHSLHGSAPLNIMHDFLYSFLGRLPKESFSVIYSDNHDYQESYTVILFLHHANAECSF